MRILARYAWVEGHGAARRRRRLRVALREPDARLAQRRLADDDQPRWVADAGRCACHSAPPRIARARRPRPALACGPVSPRPIRSLLPVGSVLNIAVGDSRYNGMYTVMDTGPKVQGRVLDLYMWSCHEALRFGRKDVQVTVLRLGWDPRASAPSLIDRLFRARASRRPPPSVPPPAEVAPDDGSGEDTLDAADEGASEAESPPAPDVPPVATSPPAI